MKLASLLPTPRPKRATPSSLKPSGLQNVSVKPGHAGLPLLSPMLPALLLTSPPHLTTSGTPFEYSIWLPPFPRSHSRSWSQSLVFPFLRVLLSSLILLSLSPCPLPLSFCFPFLCIYYHSHDWYGQCTLGSLTTFLYCMHALVLTTPNRDFSFDGLPFPSLSLSLWPVLP